MTFPGLVDKITINRNNMIISNESRGSFYAIMSGFLYGFVGYFGITVVKSSISVTNMLFWRFFISSIVIGVILIVRRGNFPKSSLKDMLIAFCNGALFYVFSTMLYFFACPYIGSGLAAVIFFTYPAIVMLLNHFLYAIKIPKIYYYAITFIILGMCLFIDTHEVQFDLFGVGLSTIAAFCYGSYIITSKTISTLPPMITTLMVCLGCTATCLLLSLATHTLVVPTTLHIWLHLFGISILSTAIPILLMLYSLNYISSEKASILSVLEPVFILIFAVTLLGEPMKIRYILGVIVVLGGALLTLLSHRVKLRSLPKNKKEDTKSSLPEI